MLHREPGTPMACAKILRRRMRCQRTIRMYITHACKLHSIIPAMQPPPTRQHKACPVAPDLPTWQAQKHSRRCVSCAPRTMHERAKE
eukprot:3781150-Alexandrium_andersonii.AAC.1